MTNRNDTLFVVGHARFPAETAGKHVFNNLTIGLALDRQTKNILEVSCTVLPPYGSEFIRELLLGKNIEKDINTITQEIRARYICSTRNALIAALEDLIKRLREHEKRWSRTR